MTLLWLIEAAYVAFQRWTAQQMITGLEPKFCLSQYLVEIEAAANFLLFVFDFSMLFFFFLSVGDQ